MIEKSLLFGDFSSSTSPPDLNVSSKALPLADLQSKATDRQNQSDLGYFDYHLDTKVHGEGKVVLVEKNVYYRNVILFVEHIQNLVIFKDTSLAKANILTLLRGSALEWYTSKLTEFDYDALNNNPGMKSWINTPSQHFKVPTSVALGLLTNETYSLDDAQRC